MLDGKGNVVQPDYIAIYYKRLPDRILCAIQKLTRPHWQMHSAAERAAIHRWFEYERRIPSSSYAIAKHAIHKTYPLQLQRRQGCNDMEVAGI